MHFKLDENIPLPLANLLKNRGHQVSSVFSEKISGIKDGDLLDLCKNKSYILITLDKDFVKVPNFPARPQQGIILLRLRSQGTLSVITAFENFMKEVPLERAKNSLIVVEEKQVRIRE